MNRREKLTESISAMPRAALVVVAFGLTLSGLIFALGFTDIGLSAEAEWAVTETVENPGDVAIPGGGSLGLTRTTLASIPPTERGDLLFRVSGSIVASSDEGPLRVRCDVSATDPGTTIARTPNKRASWPRPSEELAIQDVPELMVISFNADGVGTLGLEVRDSIRRYTDAEGLTKVSWDGFAEDSQNWVWELPRGTKGIPVTLGFAVVFKTTDRPSATVKCRASAAGRSEAGFDVPVEQELWPIPGESQDAA